MSTDPPVTVDVVQRIKRGKEQEFEALLAKIISAASTFEGYLGASVFRPSYDHDGEYRIVFKFDHLDNLKRWEHAPMRQRFLAQARHLTVDVGTFSIITGLETWFTLPAKSGMLPPPRYKMVLVSGLAIFGINSASGMASPRVAGAIAIGAAPADFGFSNHHLDDLRGDAKADQAVGGMVVSPTLTMAMSFKEKS